MGAGPSRRISLEDEGTHIMVTDTLLETVDEDHTPSRVFRREKTPEELSAAQIDDYNGPSVEQVVKDAGDLRRAWDKVKAQRSTMDRMMTEAHFQGIERGKAIERKIREQEIRELDKQWQHRVDAINRRREDRTAEEFQDLERAMRSRFRSTLHDDPCQKSAQAVVDCYRANPRRSLDCSAVVQEFLQCAERAKAEYVARS
eukprot:m.137021 g.137021  ORF g.137021 m.137021 type:complete len:201 (+) comp20215_c0_seq3:1113-1715(+)